jgi:hypothetical protein
MQTPCKKNKRRIKYKEQFAFATNSYILNKRHQPGGTEGRMNITESGKNSINEQRKFLHTDTSKEQSTRR